MICPVCEVRWAPYPKIDWMWEWSKDGYIEVEKVANSGAEGRRQKVLDNDTHCTCGKCSL
jgi:hypothetical protein